VCFWWSYILKAMKISPQHFVNIDAFKQDKRGANPCDARTLLNLIDRFRQTGSVADLPRQKASNEDRISAVSNALHDSDGRSSVRQLSGQLAIPPTSVYRILTSVLHLHPYKPRIVQTLTANSRQKRVEFCESFLLKLRQNVIHLHNVLWTDEASFYLHDVISVNNVYFWRDTNDQIIFEKPLYSPKVTVWCGFSNRFILEPYFFEGNVTADSYCSMIRNHVIPSLKRKKCFSTTIYQQDGAPAHTAFRTIEFLKEQFGAQLICKNSEHSWPPYSPDLAPPDYFLWGFLKAKVYSNGNFTNLEDLKQRIMTEIHLIPRELLQNVCDSFPEKLDLCISRQGDHC